MQKAPTLKKNGTPGRALVSSNSPELPETQNQKKSSQNEINICKSLANRASSSLAAVVWVAPAADSVDI